MIKSKQIILRVVKEQDLDQLFDLWSDLENKGAYFPASLQSASKFRREFQESGFWEDHHGDLLIVDPLTDRILGSIMFFKPAAYLDALEIAYILFDIESRGRGIMSEALSLFVDYLFKNKKVNRLQLTVIVGNEASKKVAMNCGFKHEGRLRGAVFISGRNADLDMYALLRSDFFGD